MAVIRLASEADAAAMLAIYAPYVTQTAISFEVEPPSEADFRGRVANVLAIAPWLLCEIGDGVVGYAYAGRFHARAAYQWTVEVTVYVDERWHRRGVGHGLYAALLACLRLQAFRSAVGVIALPNPASVALHERMGFRPAGALGAVGYKHGRWHDVGWWQLDLAEPAHTPPPPRALASVRGTPAWDEGLAAGAALVRA